MANQIHVNFPNSSGAAIVKGELIRINGLRARANDSENLLGLVGAAQVAAGVGASVPAVLVGQAEVLMQPGLSLAVREPIYVSATHPGRGTNVAPGAHVTPIGWVASTAGYGATSRVAAVLTSLREPGASAAGGAATLVYVAPLQESGEAGEFTKYLYPDRAAGGPIFGGVPGPAMVWRHFRVIFSVSESNAAEFFLEVVRRPEANGPEEVAASMTIPATSDGDMTVHTDLVSEAVFAEGELGAARFRFPAGTMSADAVIQHGLSFEIELT